MNLINKLKVKTKIKLISYSAIGIILSMSIGLYIFFNYLENNFNNMKNEELQFKNTTYELTSYITNLHKDILSSSILKNTDEDILEELEENNEQILRDFKKIENLLKDNVSKNAKNTLKILKNLKVKYQAYYSSIRELPENFMISEKDGLNLLIGINKISEEMSEGLEIFIILANQKFDKRITYLVKNINAIANSFIIVALISLFLFISFSYILRKTINDSLYNLDTGIDNFFKFLSQENDNVSDIKIQYDDELGEIAQHVNENIIQAKDLLKNEQEFKESLQSEVDKQTRELKELNDEILATQKDVVAKMGAIGETRSKETGNHVKRVASYSKLFAKKYGLNEKMCDLLYGASPMHDIGKVGIPDNILNKPGKLTKEEFEIMKSHASLGYEMLKGSSREILNTAAIISNEHHEKWNGTGYPNNKEGYDIHLYGRITAIADVFDALGSDRCYKKAWPLEKILDLIKEEKGKHFEPKLVDIFFDNLDEFLKIRDEFKG